MPSLTPDAIGRMLDNDTSLKPTVQCIGVKMMVSNANPNSAAERYRLAVSDGKYWCVAMLATQLNELVKTNQIHENTIFKLDEYLSNAVQGKRIIIILGLSILDPGVEGQPNIGAPVNQYPVDGKTAPAQQPVKQEGHQAAPGIYQNGSRPANYPSPGPQSSGTGHQNQAPTYGAYSGYGASSTNPPQQPGAYGQQQQPGSNVYGQQQQGGNAYGQPQPGGAYGNGYGAKRDAQGYGTPGNQGAYGQPAPDYRAGGSAIARNEAPARIVPIGTLNAYQNKWTIKARVSIKGEMRRWSNARGEGKVFSFDIVDAAGGEIKATAFNEAVDKFYELIQQGQVYTISKASLKPKRAAFNNTRHDYEIQLENGSVIKQCEDDAGENIPLVLYNFKQIEEIVNQAAGTLLDVIGIIETAGEHQTITLKNGRDTDKRSVVIRDKSNRSVEITLWGGYSNNPGDQIQQMLEQGSHPVLAVKSARVGDFNGKTLSTLNTSLVTLDPDIPEAGMLRAWYDSGGAQQETQALSDQRTGGGSRVERRCTLGQITDEGMGSNGQPAYIQVAAWVNFIRGENLFYPACTGMYNGKQCNKKLQDQGSGWWCERCQAQGTPEWRYMLSLQVSDHSGQEWLTAFQEAGAEIMGMPASELKALEETPRAFDAALHAANFRPLVFNLKVAEDTYNDETRIKKSVNRVAEVDFVKESKVLLDFIEKMKRGEEVMQAASAVQQPGAAAAAAPRAGSSYGQGGGGYTTTPPARAGYGGGNNYSAGGGGYTGGGGGGGGGYGASNQGNGYQAQNQNNGYGGAPANAGNGGQSYGGGSGGGGGGYGQNGQAGYGGAPGGYGNYQRQNAQGPAGF